jgi:hypothetical protein
MECASAYAFLAPRSMPQMSGVPHPQNAPARPSTNIFTLNMKVWDSTQNPTEESPIYCSSCNAILNNLSEITQSSNEFRWNCEFCHHTNLFNEPITKPTQDSVTYIMEPAPVQESVSVPSNPDQNLEDDSCVIFCVDVSGSMSSYASGFQTKLACVKSAILAQIQDMKAKSPNQKIVLITFGQQVKLHHLDNILQLPNPGSITFEAALEFAFNLDASVIENSVMNAGDDIARTVNKFNAGGGTALGPALALAVGLAERGKPGSKVIICTDGMANVGIGSLNNMSDDAARTFYEQVGIYANERGININVVAIEGADCSLASLSYLSELTQGNLVKVDPNALGADFAEILADRIIALNAVVGVTLHKALKFINEDPQLLQFNGSRFLKNIGNLVLSTSFSFEYNCKSEEELTADGIDMSSLTRIPLQAVIDHKTPKGAHCLRVMTRVLNVTTSQEQAEAEANYRVISDNYQLRSAQMATEGRFEEWQAQDTGYREFMMRNARSDADKAHFMQLNQFAEELGGDIKVQQMEEQRRGIDVSAASDKKKARKQVMADHLSAKISKMSKRKY